jgi:hemoglobin
MKDIESEEDIALWQNAFYAKLIADPITAPKFKDLDLPAHMPNIVQFWAFVLLEKEGYKTNVFEKHMHLGLEKIHFEKWLHYFFETTDALFKGKNAETAKQRVLLLATTFMHKLSGEYHMFNPTSKSDNAN